VAAFSEREYIFDMGLALFFGLIGYFARKGKYEISAMLIGVIMGPLFETYFLRSMRIGQGDLLILFSSPLANVLWVLVVLALMLPFMRGRKKTGVLAQTVQAGHES
jgi:putative tricarboxylic transport membrane protein